MRTKKKIIRSIFIIILSIYSQLALSQIEYRFTVSAFGNYLIGEDQQFEKWGVDYSFINKHIGFGGRIGYNVNKNITLNIQFSAVGNKGEGTKLSYENSLKSLGISYSILPRKKISPYIYIYCNYNDVLIKEDENILVYNSDRITTRVTETQKYKLEVQGFGYMFGLGLKFNITTKLGLFLQAGRFSGPILNDNIAEAGLYFNFLTKKH